ncbi:MAG: hypothetical protein PVG39_05950 [Desulfobacteraceae bacterium]|jgi:hypothetical protein
MLREIKNVIQLMVSLLFILAAIAVMLSDIYNIDLYKSILGACIVSVILGGLPFLNSSGSEKK